MYRRVAYVWRVIYHQFHGCLRFLFLFMEKKQTLYGSGTIEN
jgi:hypothetical protein